MTFEDRNRRLRMDIARAFARIEAGKVRCRCGGTLKAQVEQSEGRACNENVWLHCSNDDCPASDRWRPGFELLEGLKEWRAMQRRLRPRKPTRHKGTRR